LIGEAQVIVLALKKKEKVAILDDSRARKIARIFSIKPIGILRIILRAVRKRLLTKDDAIKILDELIKQGFRISIELYNEFLKRLSTI